MPQFLVDMNLPPSLAVGLRAAGIGATHARERGLAAASDEEIVAHARARSETIVSNDLDFGRILAAEGAVAPSVVILRVRDSHAARLIDLLVQVLPKLDQSLRHGAVVVIEDSAIRIRDLPI